MLRPAPLTDGELQIAGRLANASNATYLAVLTTEDGPIECVYKPIRGERPLWDFPTGTLGLREVAAYEVSAAGGFDVVPVTVLVDGPIGPGSLQAWVDVDADETDGLTVEDLRGADEAFLTSSTRDVHPIASVDGRALPTVAGPATRAA